MGPPEAKRRPCQGAEAEFRGNEIGAESSRSPASAQGLAEWIAENEPEMAAALISDLHYHVRKLEYEAKCLAQAVRCVAGLPFGRARR